MFGQCHPGTSGPVSVKPFVCSPCSHYMWQVTADAVVETLRPHTLESALVAPQGFSEYSQLPLMVPSESHTTFACTLTGCLHQGGF